MKVKTHKVFTYAGYKYLAGAIVDMDIDTAARLKSVGYVEFVDEPKVEEPVEEVFAKDAPKKLVVKRADPVSLVK